jgi:hypothetical protein
MIYDETTQLTTFGSGLRWNDVYQKLHQYGRVVVGGRSGDVGVSGVILGGGNTVSNSHHDLLPLIHVSGAAMTSISS